MLFCVLEKVTVAPDPDAYLNCTVYAPDVEFFKIKKFSTSNGIVTIWFPVIEPVNSITLWANSAPVDPSETAKAVVCAPPAIDFAMYPPVICSTIC